MNETITIGLPFHNNRESILDAVRSVLVQSYTNWKLVLVDDGSSDGAYDLVSNIPDPRIVVLRDGENKGLAARLNEIASMSNTPFTARMDADDMMHPRRLEEQVAYAVDNPQVDVICTGLYSVDRENNIVGIRVPSSVPIDARAYLTHSPFPHPTIMARTKWFQDNPYDMRFLRCQDQELWVRTFSDAVFACLDRPLMFIRESGTVPSSKYARSARATREIIKAYGPDLVGRRQTLGLLAGSYGKELTYRLFDALGSTDRLVTRRSQALTNEQVSEANLALSQVLQQVLPGADR